MVEPLFGKTLLASEIGLSCYGHIEFSFVNWITSIGVRAGGGGGGARGTAAPPVLKNFGQNAYDSGKSFYNTTKWSILKRLNGSVCCRSLDAGICCSFAPNVLANSQKAVEHVRFVKSLLFK